MKNVHEAVKAGRLRELVLFLDRRKLAVARDKFGRCSLHLAVLYEQPTIVQYIVQTYIETLQTLDNVGVRQTGGAVNKANKFKRVLNACFTLYTKERRSNANEKKVYCLKLEKSF